MKSHFCSILVSSDIQSQQYIRNYFQMENREPVINVCPIFLNFYRTYILYIYIYMSYETSSCDVFLVKFIKRSPSVNKYFE